MECPRYNEVPSLVWGHVLVSDRAGTRAKGCPRPQLKFLKTVTLRPGTVAHACNLSTYGGQGRWITWGQEFETSLTKMEKLHLY